MLKMYLAGPGVFLPDPQVYFDKKKAICTKYNFVGISPIDLNIDPSKYEPFEFGHKISVNNEQLMQTSDLIVADLTPYHGVSADVGTAFELGFMRALKKPLFAYSNDSEDFYSRQIKHLGAVTSADVFNRPQINGMAAENFKMVDNLMLDGALASCRTQVFLHDAPADEKYTSLVSFEEAVKHADSVLRYKHI